MLNRFLIIVLAIMLISCETTEFLKFHNFNSGWGNSEIVEFNFEEEKQDGIKNIDFILRHNNDYSFANIFLISDVFLNSVNISFLSSLNSLSNSSQVHLLLLILFQIKLAQEKSVILPDVAT